MDQQPFQTFWSRGIRWRQWGLGRRGGWWGTSACSRTASPGSPRSWNRIPQWRLIEEFQFLFPLSWYVPGLSGCVDAIPHGLEGKSKSNPRNGSTECCHCQQVISDEPSKMKTDHMKVGQGKWKWSIGKGCYCEIEMTYESIFFVVKWLQQHLSSNMDKMLNTYVTYSSWCWSTRSQRWTYIWPAHLEVSQGCWFLRWGDTHVWCLPTLRVLPDWPPFSSL